jgi:pyruvate formate lyase activating enzyme
VETCAHVETTLLLQTLQWIDWLFVDLKHVDSALHRQETGEGNELILHNIAQVASSGWDGRLVVRLPVIPGFNDTPDNLHATAAFMHSLGLGEINQLPFHRLGNSKYEQLGLEYRFARTESPTREAMLTHKRMLEENGLRCYLDFETPF